MSFKVTHDTKKVMLSVNRQLLAKRKNVNESLAKYILKVEKTAKANLISNDSNYQNDLTGSFRKVNKLNMKKGGYIQLFVNASYAPFVEFGTKGKFKAVSELGSYPSKFKGTKGESGDVTKRLTKYLQDKGKEASEIGGLIHSMLKNGTKPHPFFFPAVFSNTLTLRNGLKKALKKKR
tara:strand:- start:1961 stop:2494 length:534 start_codon:yes stop_codon:yes gene_type:complete